MFKRKKDGGFTLIELMIVIAVIGILAVVLVPKMSGIKTGAKITGVETNEKSVQAYIVSNLDKWISGKKTQTEVSDFIYTQFSTDNVLKNPFNGETAIKSDLSGATGYTTLDSSSSLQITTLDTTLVNTNDKAKGVVVVKIYDYTNRGIEIAGYDNDGRLVDEVIKIKP